MNVNMEKITLTALGNRFDEHVREHGHWIRNVDGQWYASDVVAVSILAAAYDARAVALARKIEEVKAEARRRINAVYPDWKQINMIARGVELQDIFRKVKAWSVQEDAEATALNSAWAAVKAIRNKSDQIEATIAAITDHETIDRFDVTADALWV